MSMDNDDHKAREEGKSCTVEIVELQTSEARAYGRSFIYLLFRSKKERRTNNRAKLTCAKAQ